VLITFDDARRANQPIVARAIVAMAVGFVAKVVWELATGSTLFIDSSRAGFVPLPLAHTAGGLVGVAVWLAGRRRNLARRSHRDDRLAGRSTTSATLGFNPAVDRLH
jgi:hypothetical protein